MNSGNNFEQMTKQIAKQVAAAQESAIMGQLNELVSRGLLVVELTQMTLHQDGLSGEVKVSQGCRLVLKDQEYVERLEKENKELKAGMEALRSAANHVILSLPPRS